MIFSEIIETKQKLRFSESERSGDIDSFWSEQSIDPARPFKNAHLCSSSRKAKILTPDIHWVFRGLKFESDIDIGQKGAFCKGLSVLTGQRGSSSILSPFMY